MDEYEEAILFTFGALESRIKRLEYVLSGQAPKAAEKPLTIPDRIHKLERSLQALNGKTSLLADAQELCMSFTTLLSHAMLIIPVNKHKDVLRPQDDYEQNEAPLDTRQKAAIVVDRATGFATTASQLKALADQQLPTTDGFTKLAMLRPQIAEAQERQLQQALKISELRRRNMLVNECYKQVHYLGAGRLWVDYHVRLTKALKEVERQEFKRRPDEEEGKPEQEEEDEEL
jgi:hypothetical protein